MKPFAGRITDKGSCALQCGGVVATCATVLALAGALGACSSSDVPPVAEPSGSKVIGAEGGTLQAKDGHARVTIPAGALAAPVNITLAPAPTAPTGVIGAAWSLEPEGTVFAAPVKLELDIGAN